MNDEKQTLQEEIIDQTVETNQEELHGENLSDRVKVLSPTAMVMKRFFRSKLSLIGLSILILLFLFSFIGPAFYPWNATDIDSQSQEKTIKTLVKWDVTYVDENGKTVTETQQAYVVTVDVATDNTDAEMSWSHWLGTDQTGIDLFAQLMYGGRISLTIGIVVVFISTLIGVVLGGVAGYFGKWVDQVIMRIVDILYCIPQLPILLILSSLFEGLGITDIRKLYFSMGFLCLLSWTGTARLVRGQILSLREQEFMLAAKCSGLSTGRKIFKHLIPNVMPQLIVTMTLSLGSIILTEATLGYLGLGAPMGTATWGALINYASKAEYVDKLNYWLPAGICITMAIIAFNFVGDGLRDAFDPKSKR